MGHFQPNPGRILPVLTFHGLRLLDISTGMFLPGFGRKCRIMQKLDYLFHYHKKIRNTGHVILKFFDLQLWRNGGISQHEETEAFLNRKCNLCIMNVFWKCVINNFWHLYVHLVRNIWEFKKIVCMNSDRSCQIRSSHVFFFCFFCNLTS